MTLVHSDNSNTSLQQNQLGMICAWVLLAVLSFQAGQAFGVGLLMVPCSYALLQLSVSRSWRRVFYPLLLVGLLFYSPQLGFFWTIFGPGACILWLLLAVWIPVFGLLLHLSSRWFAHAWLLVLAPVLWTGLEYFRSEVYALRFTWLTLGSSFWATPGLARGIGVYGMGFGCMSVAALLVVGIKQRKFSPVALGTAVVVGLYLVYRAGHGGEQGESRLVTSLQVTGLQMEFPSESAVLSGLDRVIKVHPETQLVVLSEYSFSGSVPPAVRQWCRQHKRFLVAGGTKPTAGSKYYNMAYVIGPTGKVEFEQAKSRPIQFFKDGMPAEQRRVWHSPWGAIGILICFDLSYAQVTDDFVKENARLLLVPTMDVRGWGAQEHELNRRTAPLRAAEYGIPIFRLGSSGISQIVDRNGVVTASAPFPGQGKIIHGNILMSATPHLPLDRFLAPLCAGATLLFILWVMGDGVVRYRKRGR
ncbi:apolipoprotein N-acyltransferase [Abditibacteriota bacterium]|nr:apolipoprotein N-acyltransferase [Abditibacteriota bacterium]